MIEFKFNETPKFTSENLNVYLYKKGDFEGTKKFLEQNEIVTDINLLKQLTESEEDFILLSGSKDGTNFPFVLVKINPDKENFLRLTGSKMVKYLVSKKFNNAEINVEPAITNPKVQTFREIAEGILLGEYKFDKYKSEKKETPEKNITFISKFDLADTLAETGKLFSGVNFSRDLSNEPANVLTPQTFAEAVKKTLEGPNTKVEIFDEKKLVEKKFGLILNVGGASSNPPCMIKIHYKPSNAKKKIVLVGKGVTYDAGGLSIKTTPGMFEMKADMAGAGTVAGAIHAAALNNSPYEIIGLLPAVENMLSGKSYKPGDVLTGYKGKTVEIGDTDAEGRLILADALEYANELKPDYIIDLATLTGAAFVALGFLYAAMFTRNETLSEEFAKAGKSTYELVWPMPLSEEYKSLLDTKMADISNIGPRHSGAITAALFLQHFVDKNIPWMHLDIAGPSIKNDILDYYKDYNTGYGVRLIYQVLKSGKL